MWFDRAAGQLVFEPSDITTFYQSPYATWMERLCEVDADYRSLSDLEMGVIQNIEHYHRDENNDHVDRLLERLEKQGLVVVRIPELGSKNSECVAEQVEQTRLAAQGGADLIVNGTLQRGAFVGRPRFLVKVAGESDFGDWQYTVWNSQVAYPNLILELCCYADMLEVMQGRLPDDLVMAPGSNMAQRFPTKQFIYYYFAHKKAFLIAQLQFDIHSPPDPAHYRYHGCWSTYAHQQLYVRDHLSLLVNITPLQIKKLEQLGIVQCKTLIGYDTLPNCNFYRDELVHLQAQAKLQQRARTASEPIYEWLTVGDDGASGLAALPVADPGDVYLTAFGCPQYEGDQVYLVSLLYLDGESWRVKDFWTHDTEQQAGMVNDLLRWLYDRWKASPTHHVFHYGLYPLESIRWLVGQSGVVEETLDQLISHRIFVDIYKVVRGALRVGVGRYDLEQLEPLYGHSRSAEFKDTIVRCKKLYAQWRQDPDGETWHASVPLKMIYDHAENELRSLSYFNEWLHQQQKQFAFAAREPISEGEIPSEPHETQFAKLTESLLVRAKDEDASGNLIQAHMTRTMAYVLSYHAREIKTVQWKLYDLLGLRDSELMENIACIACCERTEREVTKAGIRGAKQELEYRFDLNQTFQTPRSTVAYVLSQDSVRPEDSLKVEWLPAASDLKAGLIMIRSEQDLPERITLVPSDLAPSVTIETAICDVVRRYGQDDLGENAVVDLLMRRAPRRRPPNPGVGPLVTEEDGEARLKKIIKIVKKLDHSYLVIQGAPGTGKSSIGKKLIAELLDEGAVIGITSNNHRVTNKLLIKSIETCQSKDIEVEGYCTAYTDPVIKSLGLHVVSNNTIAGHLHEGVVVGANASGFCREDLIDQFDYLFIDGAGQVPLANFIGMSRCARNIVLLGDPMQLDRVQRNRHPGDSGLSVLDYLLDGNPIVPMDRGVFLATSFRMHSHISQFLSDALYDSNLKSMAENDLQALTLKKPSSLLTNLTGLQYVPVEHDGNTQQSPEEVEVIVSLTESLLGATYKGKRDSEREISFSDILYITPFENQKYLLQVALGKEAQVGSVDQFQDREAPIVIFSLCTSNALDSPGGADFILGNKRLNTVFSRAQVLAIVVGHRRLFATPVETIAQMSRVNLLARIDNYLDTRICSNVPDSGESKG